MADWKRDAWGSLAVAAVAIVLFLASMASMAQPGQSTGEGFRGKAVRGHGVAGALDSNESSAPDAGPLFGTPQPGPENGVPVLCYHYLRHAPGPFRLFKVLLYVVLSLPVLDDNEMWTQSEGAFEKQMRWLHENGYRTVTLDEMTAWQYGHRPLPAKSVVITFDDGDRSVYDYAWPILQKYGFNATYFIITRQVGMEWRGLQFLSWDELREMSDSGTFTIESHTHDLHFKVGDKNTAAPVVIAAERGLHSFDGFDRWEDRVRDDLSRSRHMVELKIGRSPRYLAWPYGHSNPYLDGIAHDVGFDRTVLLAAGTNPSFVPVDGDTIPLASRIPVSRYTISARTSLRTFKQMVTGEYQAPDATY